MIRDLRPFLLAGLLVLTGCSETHEAPGPGRIAGQVMTLDGRAPLPGARLVLMDPSTNAAPLPPVVSDRNGRYLIDGIPPGWYYLVAFAVYDRQQMLYGLIGHPFAIRNGVTVSRDVFMDFYPFTGTGAPTVRGRVIDAVTGEGIPGAFVSIGSSDLAFLFDGTGFPWETITGADGAFTISDPVVYAQDEEPLGLPPVLAAKAGYLPGGTGSGRRGEWLPLADTSGVTIRLEPGSGGAHVAGIVVHGVTPVPGVSVALSLVDTTTQEPGSPVRGRIDTGASRLLAVVPERTGVTDGLGRFDIAGVAPGSYRIQAGYLPDDGWVSGGDPADADIVVRDADVSDITLPLVRAVTPLSPPPGAVVATGQPRFTWRSVAGAQTYLVAYSRANDFRLTGGNIATTDTTVVMRAGVWGDGDHGRWSVYAYRDGATVGAPETISWLQVDSR